MGDLVLKGPLDLAGRLELRGSAGGKVRIDGAGEVLVEGATGTAAAPVLLPPNAPVEPKGTDVKVMKSLNQTVTANGTAVVTQGMLLQGTGGTLAWPGMVLPSSANHRVTANQLPVNVPKDQAVVFPSGGTASLDKDSGQQGGSS
jgi:hypothetical protein